MEQIIPGDKDHIYDHDIWSNIAYGYTYRNNALTGWASRNLARGHDLFNGVNPAGADNNAVSLGINLRKKYGSNLTQKTFEKEIFKHRDELNRWKKSELK
jgi:hypothetical protein